MIYTREIDSHIVTISDDIEIIKNKYNEGFPVVLLLTNANRFEDTSFTRYAVEIEEYDPEAYDDDGNYTGTSVEGISEDQINEMITDDYLRIAIARCEGIPLTITETDRCVIRELSVQDAIPVMNLYNSEDTSVEFLEKFFDTQDEAKEYLRRYADEVYGFYNFGIWGIFSKADGSFIGIAGFTPRDNNDCKMFDMGNNPDVKQTYVNDGIKGAFINVPVNEDEVAEENYLINLELGYAIDKKYRQQGFGFEACEAIIKYAKDNIEFNRIFVNVDPDNIAGVALAKKLGLLSQLETKEFVASKGLRYNFTPSRYVTKTSK